MGSVTTASPSSGLRPRLGAIALQRAGTFSLREKAGVWTFLRFLSPPSPGAVLYPYLGLTPEIWDAGGGCPRMALMTFHISVMSSSLCKPSQRVCVPGSPSPFLPRKPPSTATIRMASRKVGGFSAGIGFLVTKVTSAFHSASSKYTEQGTSGVSLPSSPRWIVVTLLYYVLVEPA